ncbi:hypothetical protein Glove_219g24 [Diversispora epigaea]|uniref:Uncharacterized protein n=1 Tax=Diversispora epigaea TaxID=1348612 RepID=A0A397IFT7_9GLOM|nr:hypothetical protein Glove_219g24 [Diversispora epigaea]
MERIHIILPTTTGKRKQKEMDEGNESQGIKSEILIESRYSLESQNFLLLPFPFLGTLSVDKFATNDDGFFTFMGRKDFSYVLSKKQFGYMRMFIYGR